MQDKYRLYRRSNRAQGTFYAQNCDTGARESLGTKSKPEAEKLLRAKNKAAEQPAFNREMAKVYLRAEDVDWQNRRIFYERVKLEHRSQGRACIAIGMKLEHILKALPSSGPLFPRLIKQSEGTRAAIFWKRRRDAKVEIGLVLHSYRSAWAERAQKTHQFPLIILFPSPGDGTDASGTNDQYAAACFLVTTWR